MTTPNLYDFKVRAVCNKQIFISYIFMIKINSCDTQINIYVIE